MFAALLSAAARAHGEAGHEHSGRGHAPPRGGGGGAPPPSVAVAAARLVFRGGMCGEV